MRLVEAPNSDIHGHVQVHDRENGAASSMSLPFSCFFERAPQHRVKRLSDRSVEVEESTKGFSRE